MKNTQTYDGIVFYETKRGYYLSYNPQTCKPVWMHRYVWEHENGEIPKGYSVHHINRDRGDNRIDNLRIMKTSQHYAMHMKEPGRIEQSREAIHAAQLAAPEWHRSDEGREWHKEHFEKYMRHRFAEMVTLTCDYCGKEYETNVTKREHSRFCSNNCKSAWRRQQGLDNVVKTCAFCGKDYTANKYQKTKYCSQTCAKAAIARQKSNRDNKVTSGM